jgi:hypothetical protein
LLFIESPQTFGYRIVLVILTRYYSQSGSPSELAFRSLLSKDGTRRVQLVRA